LSQTRQAGSNEALLKVRDLRVTYRTGRGRRASTLDALRDVSIDVFRGETLGVVGESGAGKTTLARIVLGLATPSHGQVLLGDQPILGRGATRRLRGRLQVVPQNPDWSLDPHMRIWRSISEPLAITKSATRRDRRSRAEEMLERVGLDKSLAQRLPHQLSGGQRQRVAIARAMITSPDLIVFDEAVTALDASVQTQILNLIRDLQEQQHFGAMFISHDLAAVRYVSHRIAVMARGQLVEVGPVNRFYDAPEHPYSQQLFAALGSWRSESRSQAPSANAS
jgi:ABC-type glutathione transport system ATPase component